MPIHMKDLEKTYKDLENYLNFHNYFDKIIVLNLNLRSEINFPNQEINQLMSNELKISKPIWQKT
jgi:hypothetical protein